jgi:hypothetical protein
LSLSAAKDPIQRPSGDQNGNSPFSVPGSGRSERSSIDLNQSMGVAFGAPAATTMDLASGESAKSGMFTVAVMGPAKPVFSGA